MPLAIGIIVLIIILAWVITGPLTEGIMDFLLLRVVYHGSRTGRSITLTFDDGPDPEYTPKLLELLRKYQVTAIFFVVGQKAKQHPDLIRAMVRDGHLVGSHTYSHVNAWFVTPWQIAREIKRTNRILEGITGMPIRYFRPPWGRLTLFELAVAQSLGMATVIWSLAAKDWRIKQSEDELFERLSRRISNGDIVLLHDAGTRPEAPNHTLNVLARLLPRLQEIGFTCSLAALEYGAKRLHEPHFRYARFSQHLLIPVWSLWERLFNRLYRVYPMSRLFRLSMVKWHFGTRELTVPSAVLESITDAAREAAAALNLNEQEKNTGQPIVLENGMPMAELHMQNDTLQEFVHIESPERMAVYSLKVLRDSLHHVAQALLFDERFQEARGIFGMTLMHRGADRLGFHVEEVPPTFGNKSVMRLLLFIMILYHPQGRKRLHQGLQEMRPKLVWMTREELLARYYKPQK